MKKQFLKAIRNYNKYKNIKPEQIPQRGGMNSTGIADFIARFVNISDKIAAVFGEKEKDDHLSG